MNEYSKAMCLPCQLTECTVALAVVNASGAAG